MTTNKQYWPHLGPAGWHNLKRNSSWQITRNKHQETWGCVVTAGWFPQLAGDDRWTLQWFVEHATLSHTDILSSTVFSWSPTGRIPDMIYTSPHLHSCLYTHILFFFPPRWGKRQGHVRGGLQTERIWGCILCKSVTLYESIRRRPHQSYNCVLTFGHTV